MAETSKTKALTVDKRFYDTLFAEVGGGPIDEVAAAASVFLNRTKSQGYEKALRGSSAYNKKSPQYVRASSGKLNPYEAGIYKRNAQIIQNLLSNPDTIMPYTYFENVKAFGEPSWAKNMKSYKDIGRQRFYEEK